MPKPRVNRGQLRAARQFNTAKRADNNSQLPRQRPEKDARVQLSWSTPDYPGAYAHVVDVFDRHGNVTLRVVLENRRHIELTVALHDASLSQHPEQDANRNAKRAIMPPPMQQRGAFSGAKHHERYDPRYATFTLIKKEVTQ